MASLLAKDSRESYEQCAMAVGGFTVTEQRIRAGAQFSWPYLRSGLGVLVALPTNPNVYDPWAFLRPFDRSVWAAVLATIFTVPMVLFVVENIMQTGRLPVGMGMVHQW
ncbi:adenylate kinase, partial [Haematococcus lacustris]